jgi:hypothetical protein
MFNSQRLRRRRVGIGVVKRRELNVQSVEDGTFRRPFEFASFHQSTPASIGKSSTCNREEDD